MAILINTQIQNNLYATGSITAGGGLTGSLSGSSTSASLAATASSVVNTNFYVTDATASNGGITCSFLNTSQIVNLTTSGSYSFTSSNIPASGQSADISIFIYNTSTFTSSLSFPAGWINVNGGWPPTITGSKSAVISLRGFDTGIVVGTWAQQV